MMLQMSEEESIIFDKFMAEKDEKRKEELYTELRRLRKIREEKELKDCPLHIRYHHREAGGIFMPI